MSAHPIDIIANAIRRRHGLPPQEGFTLDDLGNDVADVITALDLPPIVRHAAEALRDDDGSLGVPDAVRFLPADQRRVVALVVLHSIGADR